MVRSFVRGEGDVQHAIVALVTVRCQSTWARWRPRRPGCSRRESRRGLDCRWTVRRCGEAGVVAGDRHLLHHSLLRRELRSDLAFELEDASTERLDLGVVLVRRGRRSGYSSRRERRRIVIAWPIVARWLRDRVIGTMWIAKG